MQEKKLQDHDHEDEFLSGQPRNSTRTAVFSHTGFRKVSVFGFFAADRSWGVTKYNRVSKRLEILHSLARFPKLDARYPESNEDCISKQLHCI